MRECSVAPPTQHMSAGAFCHIVCSSRVLVTLAFNWHKYRFGLPFKLAGPFRYHRELPECSFDRFPEGISIVAGSLTCHRVSLLCTIDSYLGAPIS